MTYIEVKSCTDPMRWYAKYVGDMFLLLAEEETEYKTREPAGYINFILKKDSELVKVCEESQVQERNLNVESL